MNVPQAQAQNRARWIDQKVIPTFNQIVKYGDVEMLKANAPYILDELVGFQVFLEAYAKGQIVEKV